MSINTTFEHDIHTFIVRMPENITLETLNFWGRKFLQSLTKNEKSALLLDTNKHQFESIECLKLLREILSNEKIKNNISKFAFVQPRHYREPNIINEKERYFNNFEDAYCWLQNNQLDKGTN